MTATSFTFGCEARSPSKAAGGTWKPRRQMTFGRGDTFEFDQFLYPIRDKEHSTRERQDGSWHADPSGETWPTSPLLNHPSSVNAFFVAASLLRYPLNTFGPLIQSSPSLPSGTSLPSSSTSFASMFGKSLPMDPIYPLQCPHSCVCVVGDVLQLERVIGSVGTRSVRNPA
jgi:hypothetical protein